MTRVLKRHEETLMGLPYPVILLDAAEEITHPKTGKVIGIAIPDSEELAAAVALALCFMPVRLLGAEVRFIRRVMGMSGQDLAAAVEMDPATLSRWENAKTEIGAWADKAVRMAAVLRLQDQAPGSSLRPEDIVTLHFAPRTSGSHPVIEVRRSHSACSDAASEAKGWDAEAKPAA
jgi:transcriptional regulator with XRE-family HTH domain